MVKVLDLDEIFEKSIRDYVYKNVGKVKPEEIENNMPKLYEKFGDTKLKELDGKTPNTYYKQFKTDELLACLKLHIDSGVIVSDFLCEAIVLSEDASNAIIKELSSDEKEEYLVYLINMLADIGGDIPSARYLEFVLYDYPETIRELATEELSRCANDVKEQALKAYELADERVKACLVEIMSNMSNDDRILDILIEEFSVNTDKTPQYAGYLAKYGDARAIPVLVERIENEKINYSDFEELRFAIEALGGEYESQRDFTADKIYKKIKQQKTSKSE